MLRSAGTTARITNGIATTACAIGTRNGDVASPTRRVLEREQETETDRSPPTCRAGASGTRPATGWHGPGVPRSRPTPARRRPARSPWRSRRTRSSCAPPPTARRRRSSSTRSTRAPGTRPRLHCPPTCSDRQTSTSERAAEEQRGGAQDRADHDLLPPAGPAGDVGRADEPLRDRPSFLRPGQREHHRRAPRRSARARARPRCAGRTARSPGGRSRPRASRARDRRAAARRRTR